MKKITLKKWMLAAIVAAVLLTAGAVIVETGYWDRVKSVWVDWDDQAQPEHGRTQVTGVRGVKK